MNSYNKYTSKEDCFQNSIKTLKYGCLEMEIDDNKKMECKPKKLIYMVKISF